MFGENHPDQPKLISVRNTEAWPQTPNWGRPRRAEGNLSYIEFIELVTRLWEETHPGISIEPHGAGSFARYPCIVYHLELRKAHDKEPRPRQREIIDTESGQLVQISGQRFDNIIVFTAHNEVTNNGAKVAEALIEEFENFMIECQRIFKKLGVSELFYSRRISDTEESRGAGEGIVTRGVSYLVTLEKILVTPVWRLEKVYLDARNWLEIFDQTGATPSSVEIITSITDTNSNSM